MILSRNFIKDYIDLDEKKTIQEIAEDMVRVGNEYDSCGPVISATSLVIGEVLEVKMHPDSDHLHLCKVNIGKEVLDIVCGAPNVREGLKVIVAKDGAILPGGVIKKGVIRGCVSNGMLCSIKELGLDNKFLLKEDIEGIAELGEDAIVGEDPIHYLGLDDEVIDFELTANRGDELSMLGLAYELGAIYSLKVKDIDTSYSPILEKDNNFSIDIKTNRCSLYLAKKVKDVQIKESPKFIKNRLIACGIRPINNVVDISNYVMLETGQPLHFYDATCLGNKLIVRDAVDGEHLKTLDGQDRILAKEDIVIANEKEVVGLAGVMGGFNTEVSNDTTSIIIESAIFDAVSVRKTSKKILRSEASNRFEKGLDPKRTYMAMDRACHLLERYANGKIYSSSYSYDKTTSLDKKITITTSDINTVLGTDICQKEIIDVFNRLGFVTKVENDAMIVSVPSRRLDITIKEDLVEEVGRIYGINNIQGKLPNLPVKAGSYDKTTRFIRNKMVDLGLNEVLTQIFLPDNMTHQYTTDTFETVMLLDPLSVEKNALRYSLLPSLMKVYQYNKSRNLNDISIFEMAKGFYLKNNTYGEEYKLAIVMSGEYYLGLNQTKKVDFYIIKGLIEELLHSLGYENRYRFVKGDFPDEFHPGQSAYIEVAGKRIGILGKLHPNVVLDDVYVAEISLDKLFQNKTGKNKYKELNKYPSIKKDFAVILDKSILADDIVKVIKKAGGKKLTDIQVFDVYVGKNIDEDKKSIAFSLTFEDYTKTLTDEEVTMLFEKVIHEVIEKYHAVLRDHD